MKNLLPLLMILAAASAAAAPPEPRREPAVPTLQAAGGFMALSVPDLEASVRWYSEKLGLAVLSRPVTSPEIGVAVLEGGGLIVELVQRRDAAPLATLAGRPLQPDQVHGFFKAGVRVENFGEAVAGLRARGVPFAYGPFPATRDQKANVIVRDNAGNLIQIVGR